MSKPDLKVLRNDETVDAEEVTPEVTVISEVRNYTDGEGRTVVGQYPIDDISNPSFIGSFTVATNMGPVRLPIEFPEGVTLQDCFDQFDAMAQETIAKAQEEASDRQRIVTPNDLKNGNQQIIMP